MKIHRFYNPEKIGLKLAGDIVTYLNGYTQLKRVLRLNIGERVILFDSLGYDFVCEIRDYTGQDVILHVLDMNKNNVKGSRKVLLYMALVKKDTFEWIVQKATELGVSDIVPVIADRSEKKNLNLERLSKIIIEAAEQSGRGDLPTLHEICSLQEAIGKNISNGGIDIGGTKKIAFDPLGKKFSGRDFVGKDISIFIGPEGGWSEKEIELFKDSDIEVSSLGPQILRAETAAIAALSLMVF